MAYKVIKWLIIPFFAIFLMSENVSAVNFDLSNYSLENNIVRAENACRIQNGETAPSGLASCSFDSVSGIQLLKEIQTVNSYELKKGDIVEFYFIVATQQNYDASGGTYFINEVSNTNGLITLDYEAIDDYSSLDFVTFDNQMTSDNAYVLYDFFAIYKVAKVYRITQLVPSDGTYNLGLNITSTSPNRYIFSFIQSVQDVFYFSIKNFNIYRRSESSEDAAAKKDLESTQNIENQNTSDTPGGDNQSATNLIGNISGIFNQIANIPVGSSCNIDANFGNLDLGNLNLCTGKENMPFIVNFGATVFQLVFVVSTGLILVRQVLSLYDWSRK